MSERKNLFVILSGPSGVGKTSFVNRIIEEYPQFERLISSTTRAPRGTEKQGKTYYFVSKEEFEKKKKQGDFAEWAEVYGDYYGTDITQVEGVWKSGKNIIKDLDVQGGKIIKKAFPKNSVTIFLYPPSFNELRERLTNRGTETEESIKRRLKEAENEISEGQLYDFQIVNDDFEASISELKKIIESL